MEFEGDPLAGSTLRIAIEQSVLPMHAGDRVAVLAKGVVRDVAFPKKKDGRFRVHVAKADDAVVVDEGLADDIIGMHRELATGQMQLLSPDGEARMAARLVLDGRNSDAAFADAITIEDLVDLLDGDTTWNEPDDDADFDDHQKFYELVISELVGTGAVVLRGIEWARAELGHVIEARRKDAQAKTERPVDEDGNVALPSEQCPQCATVGSLVVVDGGDECVECGAFIEAADEAEPEVGKPEGYHAGLVAVVRALVDYDQPLTSAAIAEVTNLSVSRVRDIVRELKECGAVEDRPGRTYAPVSVDLLEAAVSTSKARP